MFRVLGLHDVVKECEHGVFAVAFDAATCAVGGYFIEEVMEALVVWVFWQNCSCGNMGRDTVKALAVDGFGVDGLAVEASD